MTHKAIDGTERARSIAIVLLAVLILMANNGLIIAGLTAFDSAVIRDLKLSITALKFRDTVTIVAMGVSVPFAGYLLDRIHVRIVIVAGLLMMAAGLFAYRFVETQAELYAAHVLLGASQAFCGLVAHITLVARWTTKHRGLALGAIVAGSSLGNGFAPAFNVMLLGAFGWRNAITIGGGIALLLLVLVLLVDREWPRLARDERPHRPELVVGITMRQVLASSKFWLLALVATTTAFCILADATSLSLYVSEELHRQAVVASALLAALFFSATTAQLLAGAAADRLGVEPVHAALISVMTAGAVLFVAGPGWLMVGSVIMFGFGWGGNAALLQIRPVVLFAGPALGRALAGIAVVETVGASIASPTMGAIFERSGSYVGGYGLVALASATALFCVTRLNRSSAPRCDGDQK